MAAQAEETVRLVVGEQRRIALPGRGGGGFTWQVTVSGDAGAVALGREAGSRPALPPAGGPPPDSYSLAEVLVIDGVRPGSVTLDLRLARPGTQPPGTQPPGTQPPGTQPPATQSIDHRRLQIEVTAVGSR